MKRIIALILCALMVFSLAACGGGSQAAPAPAENKTEAEKPAAAEPAAPAAAAPAAAEPTASGEPIVLGMLQPITGIFAEYGVGNKWSAERAVKEINANGGVAGRELVLKFDDEEGDPTVASSLAQKMLDDDSVLGLIGAFSTGCSTVVAGVIDGKMCQVSGSSSSTVYTDASDWAFSIFGYVATESRFMCRYLVKKYLGNPTVGIFRSDTDFAQSAYDVFVEQAAKDGVTIVHDERYNPEETDFSSMITKMMTYKPEVLVLMGTEGGYTLVNQLRSMGVDTQVCTYSKTSALLTSCAENCEGQLVMCRFDFNMDNEFERKFFEDFVAENGFEPVLQSCSCYDIVYMYKQVIEEIIAEGGELTRAAIRDKMKDIDYTGLTGHITFDESGMVTRGCYIYQVEDQKYVRRTDYSYIDQGY